MAITGAGTQQTIIDATGLGDRVMRVASSGPAVTSKKAKACTLVKSLGHFSHTDQAGANTVRFGGRLSGIKLAKGAYALVVATKLATRTSKPVTTHFTISG